MKKHVLLQILAIVAILGTSSSIFAQKLGIQKIVLGKDTSVYYIVSPSDLGYTGDTTRYEDLRETLENCEITSGGTKFKIRCCNLKHPDLFYKYYKNPVKKGFLCPVITQKGNDFYQLRLAPTGRWIDHHTPEENPSISLLASVNTKWSNDAEFIFVLQKIE